LSNTCFYVATRMGGEGYARIGHRAELRREWNYWRGKHRWRCTLCGKVAYMHEARARSRAQLISERTPMRAYYQPQCGWWHMTRKGGAS
jgi:hypothetical protein